MDILVSAYVSHQSQGRLRLRIPEKRKDLQYFSRIQETLEAFDRSVQVQVTALTGSVLIEHKVDAEKITCHAKEQGLFECRESVPKTEKRIPALPDIMKNNWVPKILLGLGTVQLIRGLPLSPTSTLFMDAYRLWVSNNSSDKNNN